ncbi:protein kinase [Caldicellulosiruptor saccharolyticus DSM 8903]|uniref:non-specific serine/threonine protein kinase n=1 Tax=Caldicellulosiruptor saccharolyticus (strain ATCC 43494 / DSM 8903 / Tp8T 6331) TaxID=351627 RepID=A4XL76_CALS8|nr:Stk1 family PASTA domain-containing Ser/Thr kinase [Caldicellulosiruptor saccharolyticus]ABP67661.1 protein kinase [Caldicellulosiruptor saccharolyticus DSM 8903]
MDDFVIGNRYSVIEKLGSGGMSIVYKAKDKVLNRHVAIKVLRSEFANDEEFLSRFRTEALAAASLSHPNIVSIYDVGEQEGMHYIVMEYVNGKTLKEFIKETGRVSTKDAVTIAIQVLRALDHAHKKGIVHRDIKPQNILIDENGIVKVTDFGIARAVSTGTIINTNLTIGSVHYFSPEQARGGYVDNRSDLYSLGVVLYEMVTGVLPFDGDTPISIALKHLQEQPIRPTIYNPDIPRSVEAIILKAMQKDVLLRYQSATEMMQDLKNSLIEPDGDFVKIESHENVATKQFQLEQLKSKDIVLEGDKKQKANKKDWIYVVSGILTALVIVAIGWLIFYNAIGKSLTPQDNEITMPDLVGYSVDDAKSKLDELGLKFTIEEQNDQAEKGTVINQEPAAGIKVKKDTTVKLTVSKGPEMVRVPDVVGQNAKDAEIDLTNAGLNVEIKRDYSDKPVDTVIFQQPAANELIEKNGTVVLTVSLGPKIEKVPVPDVTGLDIASAKELLQKAGLNTGSITYKEVTDSDSNIVISQLPVANTLVDKGSSVDLVVSQKVEQKNTAKIIIKTVILPSDLNEANVKIVVVSNNNESIVFDRVVKKEETPLQVKVPITGPSTIRMYINDQLSSEEMVE